MMVRRFLRGLRLEIRGRLQAVTYTNVSELTERVMNVEEGIKLKKGEKLQENEKSGVLRTNQ